MVGEHIPEAVERLLRQDLETYEQLEALLHLVRSRDRAVSAAELGAALRIDEQAAGETLGHLCDRGLAVEEPAESGIERSAPGDRRVRYAASAAELDSAVRALDRLYDQQPVEVAKRMTANAIERLRTAAIRTFSDAFLLKRSSEDDG